MSAEAIALLANVLIGGTALALATALLCRIPAIGRRPALVFALWLVVMIRFLVPGVIGVEISALPSGGADPQVAAGAAPAALPAAAAPAAGWSWTDALAAAWAAGAALLIALAAGGALRLRRRIAALPLAPEPIQIRAAEVAAALGLRRAPAVRSAPEGAPIAGPFAWGLLRPVVVVPEWLAPDAQLDHVLFHELAHLRRLDPWWALIERAARAALFFWPPVWWASRHLAAARERACDQLAVSCGKLSAPRYASTLIEVSLRSRTPSLAAAMAARRSQLAGRVEDMLAGRGRAGLGAIGALALGAQIALGAARAVAGDPSTEAEGLDCTVAPGVEARILANHPDADRDGDGVLSKEEICAHQLRMQRLVIDASLSAELLADLDPAGADRDRDGLVSPDEAARYREDVEMSFAESPAGPSLIRGGELLVSSLPVDVELADAGTFVCTSRARCAEPGSTDPAPVPGTANSLVLIDVVAD